MKYIYSIRDCKVGYMNPVVDANDEYAIRNFNFAKNDPKTLLHDFPGDFVLCRIADFDDQTGVITPYPPEVIA